jgi:hypothetical protein
MELYKPKIYRIGDWKKEKLQGKIIRDIFEYYKHFFNLFDIRLRLEIIAPLCYFSFDYTHNTINCIGISYIENHLFKSGYIEIAKKRWDNLHEIFVFLILHEIYHAYDWTYNYNAFKNELADTDMKLYHEHDDYYLNQPYERRANNFAEKELPKWKKYYENI